eukprot:TRINITY_DN18021_c0_g1_i1.p1 TRINITY_DN18021_c0_g1~~TRINITY_DN18021_c0_g1_i1.p1  ORF type:complete len:322 (+),score=136.41 TRINITY_DN18021_c0_g1_i1:73-966(+)
MLRGPGAATVGRPLLLREALAQGEQLKRECLALADDIGACLRDGERVAWRIFLEYDRDLSTVLDSDEVACLVTDFFGNSSREFSDRVLMDMDQPEEGEGEGDGQINFAEFLEWFEYRRSGFGPQFEAQLRVRSITGGLASLFTSSPFEDNLTRKVDEIAAELSAGHCAGHGGTPAALEDLQRCLEGLEKTLYEVKVWQSHERARAAKETEAQRWKRYSPQRTWSAKEQRTLRILFDQLLETERKDRLNVDVDLPKLCTILGYPFTFEENAMTKQLYAEDWSFEEFLRWWACRTKLAD